MCWIKFETIGHSSKNLGLSQKTLRASWCPKLVMGLRVLWVTGKSFLAVSAFVHSLAEHFHTPVNKWYNVNVNFLKILKKHGGPHKTHSRAACGPRVWDPDLRPNRFTFRYSDFTFMCMGGFVVYLIIIKRSNELTVDRYRRVINR